MTIGNRRLLRIQIETLFTHDAAGRMLCVNEPNGAPAPRFFLGRSTEGSEYRFRYDVDPATVDELVSLSASEPAGDAFLTAPFGSTPYEAVLSRSAPVERTWVGPAYRFPDTLSTDANVVVVTEKNESILRRHLAEWSGDVHRQPFVAWLVDGHAVSLCCSVRIGADAHEAGVETAPDFRGRGYATRVVSAWAYTVRALGRIPLYSTSWENVASIALARRLGLVQFGTDLHIR